MKLISKVLVAGLIFMSQIGFAQTRLVITSTSGTAINTPLNEVSEITFSDNGMNVITIDGTQTISFDDIVDLSFSAKQTETGSVSADLGDLTLRLDAGVLTVDCDGKIEAAVYNIQGVQVASAAGQSELSLDLNPLTKGVYIVRVNNKVIKVNL